jgi:spermidine synthase
LEKISGTRVSLQDLTSIDYESSCLNDEDDHVDPSEELDFAFATVTSRGWMDNLIPVLDMLNHGSGPFVNIYSTPVHGNDDDIQVFARRDIQKGEQLCLSYMEKDDHYNLPSKNGLLHLLRDYGFVDGYPQRWIVPAGIPPEDADPDEHMLDLVFDIDLIVEGTAYHGDGNAKMKRSYNVTWRIPQTPPIHDYIRDKFDREFRRLQKFSRYVAAHAKSLSSNQEQQVILEYYRSIYTAYKEAFQTIGGDVHLVDFDDVYTHLACEDFELIWVKDGDWTYLGDVPTHYQEVQIYLQPTADDACLLLGDYLHACASNRPHYHEVFVHYPARFLDKVKRVLFIGGGDSMVLHEVLKYKDLEKVVGLELDQQVVRTVFHRFGTQPHFDNDKVEWYIGDAAAALRALPREYYGTFDLVVVDILTRVAEALMVTAEYSIMEASMLLLQPNGIIIKNEDEGYKPGSSLHFTSYMVDLVYHDVPVYCLQTFVMGSNGINFAEKQPIDHGVSTLYLKDVNEFQSQFNTWYTTSNETDQEKGTEGGTIDETETQQDATFNSLGLIMIIEAEETRISLNSPPAITSLISDVLGNHFHSTSDMAPSVLSTSSEDGDLEGGYVVSFLLKEGSVVARCFPVISYCAFDIQLWSDLHKMDGIKDGLVKAVNSQTPSVYRIISGGLDTSSNDIGPPPRKNQEPEHSNAAPAESSSFFVEMMNSTVEWRNATLHSYDNRDALKQWLSQEIVGVQSILQYNIDPSSNFSEYASEVLAVNFRIVFHQAVDMKLVPAGVNVMAHNAGGNSMAYTVSWNSGNMVAFWDGTSQLVVNLFVLSDIEAHTFKFVKLLRSKLRFRLAVGESFPRGVKRVINFSYDYAAREKGVRPYWA